MQREPLVLMTGKDPLGPGGHESYVRAHALALIQLGFEPHLFYLGGRPCVERTDIGVLHRVASPPRPTPPTLLHVPLFAQIPWLAHAAARFLAHSDGHRVIHSFGIFAAAGRVTTTLLARRGLPSIPIASAYATRAYELGVMRQALASHQGRLMRLRYRVWIPWVTRFDDPIEGWGYRRSRLVLVNYESVRGLLRSAYGPRLNLRRIPYCSAAAFGTGGTEHRPAGTPVGVEGLHPPDAPLIVCVSRHDPRKGIDRLLLALQRLRRAGVLFRACLVGPGPLLEAHRRLANRLGLDPHVTLLGAVADPVGYLRSADVFVLPSLAESSGSVSVLEALQHGKAIVASACDGIPEDLTDGRDALLVAPGDPAALATAIGRLLSSSDLRARLAAEARTTYEARFSRVGFVAALGTVYEELARGASTAPWQERIASAT